MIMLAVIIDHSLSACCEKHITAITTKRGRPIHNFPASHVSVKWTLYILPGTPRAFDTFAVPRGVGGGGGGMIIRVLRRSNREE